MSIENEQLFDRDTDPGELTNLAGEPAFENERVRLRKRLAGTVRNHGGHEALDGNDLRGTTYDESSTRFGGNMKPPWGRRPY